MTDGITFDKTSYNKGETIIVTVTDSGRAGTPGTPDTHEEATFTTTLSNGQTVNGTIDVVTHGTPDTPAKTPGSVTATGGRTVSLIAGTDTGTAANYSTQA